MTGNSMFLACFEAVHRLCSYLCCAVSSNAFSKSFLDYLCASTPIHSIHKVYTLFAFTTPSAEHVCEQPAKLCRMLSFWRPPCCLFSGDPSYGCRWVMYNQHQEALLALQESNMQNRIDWQALAQPTDQVCYQHKIAVCNRSAFVVGVCARSYTTVLRISHVYHANQFVVHYAAYTEPIGSACDLSCSYFASNILQAVLIEYAVCPTVCNEWLPEQAQQSQTWHRVQGSCGEAGFCTACCK